MNLGTDTITTSKGHANLDYFYGPWENREIALVKVPKLFRRVGLTVGILNDLSGITEWQWKKGIEDRDLVEKTATNLTMSLINPADGILNTDSNTPVIIRIEGESVPASIEVYSKNTIDGNYQTTNYRYPGQILKNSDLYLNLNLDSDPSPRTTYYAIRVIDTNGNVAKTEGGADMLEFVLNYKEVQASVLGSSEIFGVKVKSLNNIRNKSFIFTVSKIEAVEIINGRILIGENIYKNISKEDLETQSSQVVLLDNLLDSYKGNSIKIQINYTMNGEQRNPFELEVIKILGTNVFSNAQLESPPSTFQNTNFDIKLYYEAEEELSYNIAISSIAPLSQQTEPKTHPTEGIIFNSAYQAYKNNIITLSVDLTDPGSKIEETKHYYIYVNNNYETSLTDFSIVVYPYSQETFIPPQGSIYSYYNNISDIANNMMSSSVTSFIWDMECFIPYTADVEEILFNYFNIEIKRDYITFSGITYPTPIQEQVSLGFMYNVHEGSYIYNALFINGVLCYKIPVEEGFSPVGLPANLINKLTIHRLNFYFNYNNSLPAAVSSSEQIDYSIPHIITRNYLSQHSDSSEELPIFKLTAVKEGEMLINGNDIYSVRGIIPGRFGNIGEEKYPDSEYYINIIKNNLRDYNVLMSQTTNLKKILQKKIGVICRWKFGEQSGLVEVHTQGTSTLNYALPNFKFTFLDQQGKKLKLGLVPNEKNGGYYIENTLTAKADYMDSSHLNNTPTAMFFNRIVQSPAFHSEEVGKEFDYRSPSAVEGGLDAIEGFPIILQIKDIDKTTSEISDTFVNYGSFMLNIDKTGDNLKFKPSSLTNDTCISFEGTSNADEVGLSSRFVITQALENDFNTIHTLINTEPINWYYNQLVDGEYRLHYTKVRTQIDNTTVTEYQYSEDSTKNTYYTSIVKILNYLSEGLEYRYPDNDIISQKDSSDDGYYILMPFNHFKRLFNMFYWVATSNTLNDTQYKEQFRQLFNFEYCALYFIQLMVFGQTDNLGKNCMFDQWTENGLWYPRPYDLDSQTGLNNVGKDLIPPFVEIRPNFSLNYDQVQSNAETIYNDRASLVPGDKYYEVFQENPSITFTEFLKDYVFPENHLVKDSKLPYEGKDNINRYGYSSPTTNLWINFYQRFKDEICAFYATLRNLKVNEHLVEDQDSSKNTISLYSPETIVQFVKSHVIDKLGVLQYNLDFRYKYLTITDTGQQFAFGNRYYKYRDWMTKRFSFCDVYFNYEHYLANVKSGNKQVYFNFPQYFLYRYEGRPLIKLYYDGINPVNLGVEAASVNYDLYFSPKNIISGDIYNMFNSCSPKIKLNSLLTLSANQVFFDVANISDNTYMTTLSLNGINKSFAERIIPVNVQKLTITNSNIIPDLSDLKELTQLTIENCNNLTLNIINCTRLINLKINRCSNLNLTVQGLQNLESFEITRTTFSKLDINTCNFDTLNLKGLTLNNLSFSGNVSNIEKVDLRNTKINSQVNIEKLNTPVLLLNSSTIPGIICDTPKEFTHLSITNASLSYWKTSTDSEGNVFDGSLFTNLSNVISPTESASLSKLNSGAKSFNFQNCQKIQKVKNLNISKDSVSYSGEYGLFKNCFGLQSVTNSIISWSGAYMFYDCVALQSIPSTITINNNTGAYMFTSCNKLAYNYVEAILDVNPNITNFSYFLEGKTFDTNTTINLSKYSKAANMTRAFSTQNIISNLNVSNKNTTNPYTVTFTGILSENLTNANGLFTNSISNCTYIFQDWDNLLSQCSNLTNCTSMFAFNNFAATNTLLNTGRLITSEFFSNSITNTSSMFASTKNLIISSDLRLPSSILNASKMFMNSSLADSSTMDIQNIFVTCTNINNLVYAFNNCRWIRLEQPLNLNSSSVCNIYGIFGRCNTTLHYGFGGNWKSEYSSSDANQNYIDSDGVYSGNTVVFDINQVDINASSATKLFDSAKFSFNFDINDTINQAKVLTISIGTTTDIRKICSNIAEQSKNYINIEFKNNSTTTTATEAFLNCRMLRLNSVMVLPNTLTEASYMFSNSTINIFPDLHNTQITNASYMFKSCKSLQTIYNPMQWADIEGYSKIDNAFKNVTSMKFVLPDTLTNVTEMFKECYNLQGGIPINFIKWTNTLTSLNGMFDSTGILVTSISNYPFALNIADMFPSVINVTRLFRYNWLFIGSDNLNWQRIDTNCFSNCTIISYLFEHNDSTQTSIMASLPSILNLSSITNAAYAFHNVSWGNITLDGVSNALMTTVEGMFATGGNTPRTAPQELEDRIFHIYNNINPTYKSSTTQFRGFVQGYNKIEGLNGDNLYQVVSGGTDSMINTGHSFNLIVSN